MDPVSDEMLLMYIEDELDAPQAANVERVLARDDELRRKVAQMMRDRDQLRSMPKVAAPSDILARVLKTHLPEALESRDDADATGELEPIETSQAIASEAAQTPLPALKLAGPSHSAPPAFRWNIALAYSGMAAMLLLGLGVVFETLSDSKIINLAQNKPLPGSLSSTPVPPIEVPHEPMAPLPAIPPAPTAPVESTVAQGEPPKPAENPTVSPAVRAGPDGGQVAMNTDVGQRPAPGPAAAQPTAPANGTEVTPVPTAVASSGSTKTPEPAETNQGDWQSADVYRDGLLAAAGAPIVVNSPAPQQSEADIAAWISKSHGQILSPWTSGPTTVAMNGAQKPGVPSHRKTMVVQIMPGQVNALLTFLNSGGAQVARLNTTGIRPAFSVAAPAKPTSTTVGVASTRPADDAKASLSSATQATVSFEPAKPETIKPISVTIVVNE